MEHKNEVKVTIGGKVYTLVGNESEKYIHHVAKYINEKIEKISGHEKTHEINTRIQSVLLAINIADDYFKAKIEIEEKEKQVQELHQEIERLKKELEDYIDLFEQE